MKASTSFDQINTFIMKKKHLGIVLTKMFFFDYVRECSASLEICSKHLFTFGYELPAY